MVGVDTPPHPPDDAQMFSSGKAVESSAHMVGECEMCKEERNVSREGDEENRRTLHGEVWYAIK